ncbi:uncharacterized protein B0H64DRAFT_402086 [Chaetomium fimeti]|uniref:Uncharacterized protein n=1 Tax=Chaetomium fimeti TaxID=1854472 RepID=A0AAE0HEG1_9PEZI|nr:hypothetical protein B0H64DRAFT_402086 [Chaetomium fimeti]
MGNSKFVAHYWRHKCLAESPEDGDNVDSSHPNLKYDRFSFIKRALKQGSIMGRKCEVEGCKYEVNEATVLVNKEMDEIQTLGGKNLYPERTRAYKMKCCKRGCRNKHTTGHSTDISTFREPGGHGCSHALDYQDAIHNFKITRRLNGCTCVMINKYEEEVETWEPDGQPRKPIPGGPLDLDNKYHEMMEKKAVEFAANS